MKKRERKKKRNHLKNRIDDAGDGGGKYLFTQLTEKEERKIFPVVGRTKSSSSGSGGGGGTGLGRLAHAFVEYKKNLLPHFYAARSGKRGRRERAAWQTYPTILSHEECEIRGQHEIRSCQ
jgi:hypothetical protein